MTRTAIDSSKIPTFERFVLAATDDDNVLHVFMADGRTLLGTVQRLPVHRGRVSRQWHVTGFSKNGTFVFDFEQIEAIVNEWLGDPDDVDDTDWIFGDDR